MSSPCFSLRGRASLATGLNEMSCLMRGALTLVMLLASLVVPTRAHSSYTFENVVIPGFDGVVDHPSLGNYFFIDGISDNGTLSGGYFLNYGAYHGFILRNGSLQTVDFPGARATALRKVTASGAFWGRAFDSGFNHFDFIGDQKGNLTPVQFPMQFGQLGGINDSGVIAASTYSEENGYFGVPILIQNGLVTWLDIRLGRGDVWLTGINDRGTVVGFAYDENVFTRAFVFDGQTAMPLEPPDRSQEYYWTSASGLNDRNQVVGVYEHPELGSQGFLYDRGEYTTIKYPDPDPPRGFPTEGEWEVSTYTYPNGINNRGQIVGQWEAFFINFSVGATVTLYGSIVATPSR